MSYAFTNMPGYLDDGITHNHCWPSTLTSDPGFALLTDDSCEFPGPISQHLGSYSYLITHWLSWKRFEG